MAMIDDDPEILSLIQSGIDSFQEAYTRARRFIDPMAPMPQMWLHVLPRIHGVIRDAYGVIWHINNGSDIQNNIPFFPDDDDAEE